MPATGVGRYINNTISKLAGMPEFDVELLVSKEYVKPEGTLDSRSPLARFPYRAFPLSERLMERTWKLLGQPTADRWCAGANVIFLPAEARFPTAKPVVLAIHDVRQLETNVPWHSDQRQAKLRRRAYWWLSKAADDAAAITTLSEFSKSRIAALLNIRAEKIHVTGCGVEDLYFRIATEEMDWRRPCDEPFIITVGGLHPEKGVTDLIELADRMAVRLPSYRIVCVGQQHQESTEKARRRKNIIITGKLDDRSLLEYMKSSVAMLTLSHYEGFGIPAAEAMAAGVPSVVADRTSLPEVVGESGLIVDPSRMDNVIDLLQRIETDSAFREVAIAQGRSRSKGMTWSSVVNKLADVIRSVE